MEGIKKYWMTLYETRYFWWSLVKLDLQNKFRRSKLGILWTIVNPLLLSLLMGFVFGVAFHFELKTYMPYILTGILFWDLFSSAFTAGGMSILASESFMRQCSYPPTLYTLKNALVYTITFLIALFSLFLWVGYQSMENLFLGIALLPPALVLYFLIAWGGTTIAGYLCVQYRDYPMMAPLILQALWYASPVFFDESLFRGHHALSTWFDANPVTHLLNLMRAPMLYGHVPTSYDYISSIVFTAVIVVFALYLNRVKSRDIIFYL